MARKCLASTQWLASTFSVPVRQQPQLLRTTSRGRRMYSRSGVPERSRRLPNTRDPFRLSRWQRRFIFGMVAGAILVPTYRYYEHSQSQDSFVKYRLISKEAVSSTASIFQLQPQDSSNDFSVYKEAWRRGIWNVHFKQPQIQIVRAYTPLPPTEKGTEKENKNLRFLIRRDLHGEVSNYLHNLPVGAEIELRGPNLEYHLTPDIRQVVFFAGGTGIAAALQLAYAMFNNKSPEDTNLKNTKKLHILWASRKREDCAGGVSDITTAEPEPPQTRIAGLFTKRMSIPDGAITSQQRGTIVRELDTLKATYPGRITVEYFVNEEDTWLDEDTVLKALSRFNDNDLSVRANMPQEQRQVLISGPAGFITYLAGPKEWKNGREEQGGIGRILARALSLNPHNVKVWKL